MDIRKISYCVYIFHYFIIMAYEQSLTQKFYLDEASLIWLWISITTATSFLAGFVHLFYEIPMADIWQICLTKIVPSGQREKIKRKSDISTDLWKSSIKNKL